MKLHVVADPGVFDDAARYLDAVEHAARALSADHVLQVRIKTAEPSLVARACERALRGRARVVLNANVALDEALAIGAHGVHWPEDAIPAVSPRVADALAGASVHDTRALRRAEDAGARYAFYGPVYDARSAPKPGVGLAALGRIARATTLPVIAIGGLTPERVAQCMRAGAAGVAALSGVMCAPDPARAVERFVEALIS